ncbi:sigma D regulator [Alteromonas antoniana]|uniref:sigma D regulator n=1 Tax=Alteromonas antoniana TaxID=2803813 RepID=UPI001C4656DA|nr:sigma D regulator [Alteromonas antoniana]
MLNKLEQAKDKWGGRHTIIDNWLHARQMLLIKYCELAGLSGGHDQAPQSHALPDASAIDAFCEAMMDYLSAGHFEVYDMLVNDDAEGQALKQKLYPEIAVTTDSALTFNDAYTDAVSAEQASQFDTDLASLGETLEVRFELEDQLIGHMYHSEQALASAEIAG